MYYKCLWGKLLSQILRDAHSVALNSSRVRCTCTTVVAAIIEGAQVEAARGVETQPRLPQVSLCEGLMETSVRTTKQNDSCTSK